MTQVELNSSELNLIIPALKMDRQRILERFESKKQPQIIEDMPDEIQYLIEKLEPIYDKAKEERKDQEMTTANNSNKKRQWI